MSLGLQLILSTTLAATPPACSWAHPGANPYRGDPVRALADFDLPPDTRDKLRQLMRTHHPTDTAVITRDDIVGGAGAYTDLREMHSGHGRVCHGAVDRSAWSTKRREQALVYCVDDACVIVPAICHNVSLVSRKPEHVADDEGPIDIEPAAGPPNTAATPETPPDEGPLGFVPTPEGGGGAPGAPITPGGGDAVPPIGVPVEGGPSGGAPPVVGPIDGFPVPGGGAGGSPPIGSPPGDGGGFCCDTGPGMPIPPGLPGTPGTPGTPGAPGGPGTPPVITPVPEAPAWLMLLAGVLALRPWRRTAAKRR